MRTKTLSILAAVAIFFALNVAPASRANFPDDNDDDGTKVLLLRGDCATSATSSATTGFAVFDVDDDGEDEDEGEDEDDDHDLVVNVQVKKGMKNTSYRVYLLTGTNAACSVAFVGPCITTNRKGKGHAHISVAEGTIMAGQNVAVQLVSPCEAPVPGPGPFADVLTSRFTPFNDIKSDE
jgi:hypothetical protein